MTARDKKIRQIIKAESMVVKAARRADGDGLNPICSQNQIRQSAVNDFIKAIPNVRNLERIAL